MVTFAENLKKYRKLKGLTQNEIAKRLNMSAAAYGFYEQGRTKPDASKLATIADILQISVDKLVISDSDSLKNCIITWELAGYGVTIADDKVYITKKVHSVPNLLPGFLPTEEENDIFKHNQLMNKLEGITYSREDFVFATQRIKDNAFVESLPIYNNAIEKEFLYKALEKSISITT